MACSSTRARRHLLKALLTMAATAGFAPLAIGSGADLAKPGFRKIRGTVRLNGQPAQEGMRVQAGDTVTTEGDAEAVYVIGANAYLQRASSSVSFTQASLRVITGKLLSVFGKGDMRLETPSATIGIRGTGCYIEAEGQGKAARTYFCLCYGTAELSPLATPEARETITTQHHDKPLWINNDPTKPGTMNAAQVINHHDYELVMLEALVGRQPPFISETGKSNYRPSNYGAAKEEKTKAE